jgi:pimeloyl-ACP methyl ester carboxylesterase
LAALAAAIKGHATMKAGLTIIAAALCLAACSETPRDNASTDTAANVVTGEHRWTAPDGEQMPYVVTGNGEVTVILVHCWMCNRTFWSEQVPVLSRQYRTIAVDLPGHGEASAGRDEWTVAAYGDDVAGLIRDLDLQNVILVGHSMGGPVSLRAAALAGERVRGIVAVDTLHDADFEFSGEQIESFMTAFESDFVGTCGTFVAAMFTEEGVEEIANTVRDTSCDEERAAVGQALMRNFGSIDMPRWFSDAGVPIRAINAATPNPTRVETNRKYADFDVVLIDDVGHYLQMTRPEAFNPLLLEAIADILQK